jgi:hypothetical protein
MRMNNRFSNVQLDILALRLGQVFLFEKVMFHMIGLVDRNMKIPVSKFMIALWMHGGFPG